MKGRLSLLGVLLVALFAILVVKSDRASQIPAGIDRAADTVDEVPTTVVPREEGVKGDPVRREQSNVREQSNATGPGHLDETQIPSSSETEATAPAGIGIELTPQPAVQKEDGINSEDRMPYPWMDQVQEPQPGFVDPNRLDARDPSGDPILQRPAPTGPGAGAYDPNDRFAEPD